MNTKYSYTPLPEGHCRLLELLPGKFDDNVHVRLKSIRLGANDSPSYEALSYVWGSEEEPQKVWIKPQAPEALPFAYINVTRNLFGALRHLRRRSQGRILWVDAICINQEDVDERSEQVRQMPLIHRTAAQVTIWLGPAAEATDGAIATLRSWAQDAMYDTHNDSPLAKDDYLPGMTWTVDRSSLDHRSKIFKCVRALFDRPWFARLWVRQEAYLSASKATVFCGYETLPWNEFVAGALAFYQRRCSFGVPDREQFRKRRVLVLYIIGPRRMSLLNALLAVRSANCSDPRDKVYGVLGMAEDTDPEVVRAVKVDYNIGVEDLYKQVAKIIIDKTRSLQILRCCFPSKANSRLPTWVPDWNTDNDLPHVTNGVLYAEGVQAATVIQVEPQHVSCKSTPPEHVVEIRRLHAVLSSYLQDVPSDVVLDLMARTISDGKVSEHTVYQGSQEREDLLALQIFSDELHRLLKSEEAEVCYTETAYESARTVLNAFSNCRGHAFAVTDKGHVAKVPEHVTSGDVLAVLLGCHSVVALRPHGDATYQLVGTCFVHGLNWGEALVGPVPAGWRFVRVRVGGSSSGWQPTFRHHQSGLRTLLDPRVKWDILRVSDSEKNRSRLSKQSMKRFGHAVRRPDEQYLLEEHGVNLTTFRLV